MTSVHDKVPPRQSVPMTKCPHDKCPHDQALPLTSLDPGLPHRPGHQPLRALADPVPHRNAFQCGLSVRRAERSKQSALRKGSAVATREQRLPPHPASLRLGVIGATSNNPRRSGPRSCLRTVHILSIYCGKPHCACESSSSRSEATLSSRQRSACGRDNNPM